MNAISRQLTTVDIARRRSINFTIRHDRQLAARSICRSPQRPREREGWSSSDDTGWRDTRGPIDDGSEPRNRAVGKFAVETKYASMSESKETTR